MATTPNLGYGQRGEVPIDAYNQWQRSQPWYRTLIQSFGQDLNNVHLNDNQKQQVIRAAQANGVVVDEGHNGQEVDDSGNFQAKSSAVRLGPAPGQAARARRRRQGQGRASPGLALERQEPQG